MVEGKGGKWHRRLRQFFQDAVCLGLFEKNGGIEVRSGGEGGRIEAV